MNAETSVFSWTHQTYPYAVRHWSPLRIVRAAFKTFLDKKKKLKPVSENINGCWDSPNCPVWSWAPGGPWGFCWSSVSDSWRGGRRSDLCKTNWRTEGTCCCFGKPITGSRTVLSHPGRYGCPVGNDVALGPPTSARAAWHFGAD